MDIRSAEKALSQCHCFPEHAAEHVEEGESGRPSVAVKYVFSCSNPMCTGKMGCAVGHIAYGAMEVCELRALYPLPSGYRTF